MLNVSQAVKDKFQSDLCRKEIRITIGNTVLTNEAIYKDGFRLTESVMDGAVEFVGCIASILEFKVSTLSLAKGNYRGQTVTAEVAVYLTDGTLSAYVPLFHGFVDECTKSADGYYQEFVCYDRLAYLSDEPGYNMYKAAFNGSSVDLETFRDAIVLDCDMDAVNSQVLPNDDIIFKKRKRNKDVTAMALLRHIAQINGTFGILNRDNRFEFRGIDDSADPEAVAYYRELTYSDHIVRPVGDPSVPTGSITIRTSSQDAGVTVDWTNYQQYAGTDPGWSDESQDTYLVDDDDADVVVDSYIIEGNLIAYKLKKGKKQVIGANILASLGHDAVFREYSVKCNGLPYVECCDKVLFTKGDQSQIEFVVTKRVLEGVQNMTDTYSCTINAQDSNNKTFVSNVDNSTNSLGGNPDDALGLTEKTITENGTYSALDDGAEGYSQVTVDVEGGGGEGKEYYYPWTIVDMSHGTYTMTTAGFSPANAVEYNGKIHFFGALQTTDSAVHVSWNNTAGFTQESVLPVSTHGYKFVVQGGKIHLLGGQVNPYAHYSWDGISWTTHNNLPLPINRNIRKDQIGIFDDKLYIVGGLTSSTAPYVHIIDLDTNTVVAQYPTPWSATASFVCETVVYKQKLHIMSFSNSADASFRNHYTLDSLGNFTKLNDVPWVSNTCGAKSVIYDDTIHRIGGPLGASSYAPLVGHFIYKETLDMWIPVGGYPIYLPADFGHSESTGVLAPDYTTTRGLNVITYNDKIHVVGLQNNAGIGYAGHWTIEKTEIPTL